MSGYNVVLRDIEQGFLDKAMGKIKWSLDKLVSKEKITQEQSDDIYSRIKPIVDLNEAVKDAELVIEVVPEIMDLKKKVYAELDKAAGPEVVFASNTSTLPITEIASTTSRPEKFVGIHFFNPPQLMKLVEVIPGEKTSQEITDLTIEFVKSLTTFLAQFFLIIQLLNFWMWSDNFFVPGSHLKCSFVYYIHTSKIS